ncbi:hypothetical protein NLX83_10540 [Allokutzneria sp. A3M-2-11 16]|uniref:hypothetical protein n=1 Tax=Allokutzneria sp. A3M-2-11 16 TaxID=2962043 RepID=UPI0020B76743|nr:hypothetical protein [Allokutzneria sp. A3M-2-11 16]MCP3799695.1 hypothetical protein [Allokutzneria sp. A3M-2-11 16]
MADKKTLVLHLSGVPSPLLFAISDETAAELTGSLTDLVRSGSTSPVRCADGSDVVVDFGKIVTAHIGLLPTVGEVYGAPGRRASGLS